ncbi:hypothetical protein BX661DRAFT_176606 [Kickxella alabastrina]|uniref:uncharacterized protein n=1 Tax=Kickxella alabastrina TaxID=61397 RepID=UPI00221FE954|nr:uncharacterized protein BX661DRAFT_176606 [Kickxella alabastrina]KAI7834078.1 hypothetical protein BX661DRAFT_176606 [Kickxella alabastrina]KAJ1933216.1 hypothetical protein GGF37_006801 [Kickxella alabastrina]
MSFDSKSSSSKTVCAALTLGKLGNITHKGWLYRYSSSSFLKGWKRRFFAISDERMYVFKENYHDSLHYDVIDLTTFRQVQQISTPRKTKYGFLLRSLRRPSVFDEPTEEMPESFEVELYADTEYALNEWMSAISKVFVTMDLRTIQSTPLSSFDALVHRAGLLQPRVGGSILKRMDKHRATTAMDHLQSSSTLVSGSPDGVVLTHLSGLDA